MPIINVSAVLSGLTFSFIAFFPSWLDINETKMITGLKFINHSLPTEDRYYSKKIFLEPQIF